jgi:hypothetical protein
MPELVADGPQLAARGRPVAGAAASDEIARPSGVAATAEVSVWQLPCRRSSGRLKLRVQETPLRLQRMLIPAG